MYTGMEMHPTGSSSRLKSTGKRAEAMSILAQIPEAHDVQFEPLQTDKNRPPQLRIPLYIDVTDPYQLFTLFFTETLWKLLATNTNSYAYAKESKNHSLHQRSWYPTTPEELKVFVGAQIYMGFTKEPELKDYWDDGLDNNTVHANHPLSAYITQYRYEQLKRYFHISSPPEIPGGFITTHYPPEPTPEQELQMSEEQLSANISIDEAMVRSHGRSSHTFKLPNKPISQGFKLFVLADHDYVYYFYPASRTKGVIEIGTPTELTKTGQMVYELIQTLPRDERNYIVYLDNYFTSIDLFKKLRDIQIGACGTTRPTSASKDFSDLLKKLKDLSNYIPYHKVCAIPVRDVLCVA
ncbi:conserved hypothetical protein [Talaromyces stipitatus ATCC 10500]|uniref:PiggyBac transposable element-derived protein domain-containing protein n=1 Tax=Talaromyces stipitatus (strain ATCC 10500 / CBS 375.48 / QM 6759 / NRRL 1006) TaxID=441959 RepID=B8LTB9_TALSN|nr:uncharacterized protein TSTA_059910 [Talaromyces stipitatus ATCC 10500]EED22493.1 conserved hypothetical protein [Talaromyces stipitatus ATCC 10500]